MNNEQPKKKRPRIVKKPIPVASSTPKPKPTK